MKERPIIFNAEMVRAILDGRKTRTSRVIKLRNGETPEEEDMPVFDWKYEKRPNYVIDFSKKFHRWEKLTCPYGKPGDRLWVREKFALLNNKTPVYWDGKNPVSLLSWKPSIYMPRWASRITLEITNVGVERVQDISEKDAIAEGCNGDYDWASGASKCDKSGDLVINQFQTLWNGINLKRGFGWDKNNLIWAICFKQITP